MPPYRIIALGDSLTYGYPFGKPMSWVELTSKELQVPILNQGINGDTLRELNRRLTFDVLDLHPEICVVMAGTNDVFQGIKNKMMQEQMTKIAETLKKEKVQAVLGLPPPVEAEAMELELGKFRRWLKKFAKEKGLTLIDFYAGFIDPKKKKLITTLLDDGVHPTSRGYETMAKAAVKSLKSAIK